MSGRDVGAVIHHACGKCGRLEVILDARGVRVHVMADSGELAIFLCADRQALFRARTRPHWPEHLWPFYDQLYRTTDLLRRHDSKEEVRPLLPFASEAAANIVTDHVNVGRRNAEKLCKG